MKLNENLVKWRTKARKVVARSTSEAEFMDIWRKLYQTLHESDHHHWILRDFHSPNIMRLKGQGTASVGIIDFQDALIGNAAYDVASLCQDARLTIPPTLEAELLAHYIAVVKQQ